MSNKKKGSNVWRNLTQNLKIGTSLKGMFAGDGK